MGGLVARSAALIDLSPGKAICYLPPAETAFSARERLRARSRAILRRTPLGESTGEVTGESNIEALEPQRRGALLMSKPKKRAFIVIASLVVVGGVAAAAIVPAQKMLAARDAQTGTDDTGKIGQEKSDETGGTGSGEPALLSLDEQNASALKPRGGSSWANDGVGSLDQSPARFDDRSPARSPAAGSRWNDDYTGGSQDATDVGGTADVGGTDSSLAQRDGLVQDPFHSGRNPLSTVGYDEETTEGTADEGDAADGADAADAADPAHAEAPLRPRASGAPVGGAPVGSGAPRRFSIGDDDQGAAPIDREGEYYDRGQTGGGTTGGRRYSNEGGNTGGARDGVDNGYAGDGGRAVTDGTGGFRPGSATPGDPSNHDTAIDSVRGGANAFDNAASRGSALPATRGSASGLDPLTAAAAATGGENYDRPGLSEWEGLQTPALSVQKTAPGEIQVGQAATFTVKVQNVGRVKAAGVMVFDQVPRGTRLIDTTPQADRAADGSLMWSLGALDPGQEATVSMQVLPQEEGQIGSVARVVFAGVASARSVCTRPELTITHSAPPSVLIGETLTLAITVKNTGSGAATNVVVEENVPEGFTHPAGSELEYELGTLAPGESRNLELTLVAAKAGRVENLILARGDANLLAEDRLPTEVIAPQLAVGMKGPSRRYLDREAKYTVLVENAGTAPARDIELVAFLPRGMKFVGSNNHGQYDPQQHAVYWSLEELPPAEIGAVEVSALPIEPGEQKLRVEGRASLGLSDAAEQAVTVEGLAELSFEISDSADPIEVGSETIYTIRVTNRGSKAAANVQLVCALPPEMQPVSGEGPTRVGVSGQQVACEPIARLAPDSEAVYKIRVAGLRGGDHRIRVQISSADTEPILKEEGTRVYSDQ